jgi:CheY-like chemotaxis protein
VVDDNDPFRSTVAELLTLRGFRVVGEAANGDEALAAVDGDCPDGVLLDVNMPGQDGYTVSALLAVMCPAARIVLTSSEAGQVAPDVLERCGAVAFVPKMELAASDLQSLFRRPEETFPDR